MYGDRAFPYRVVSELRRVEPTTAPENVLDEMLTTLSRSLGLDYARIESAGSAPEDRFAVERGELRGQPTVVELEVAGTAVGRLEMEVSPMREPFGPRDRRLLEDVGTQVGALVQALAAGRELQRTRERLVATREEERRRLRRDLHDGLGPSLATTLMRLEVARDLVDRDPVAARDLVAQLVDQTEADIGEVRRLVDGLRPPALDQLGLVLGAAAARRPGQPGGDARVDGAALDRHGRRGRRPAGRGGGGRLPDRGRGGEQRGPAQRRHAGRRDAAASSRMRWSSSSATMVAASPTSAASASGSAPCGIGPRSWAGPAPSGAAPGGGTQVVAHLPLADRSGDVGEEV